MPENQYILPPEAITAIARSITLEMQLKNVEMPIYISTNKAFKRYGTARTKRWLKIEGLIRQNASGGNIDLRVEDLERAAISEEYTHGITEKRKYNKIRNQYEKF